MTYTIIIRNILDTKPSDVSLVLLIYASRAFGPYIYCIYRCVQKMYMLHRERSHR
jgi:hypothetical protein